MTPRLQEMLATLSLLHAFQRVERVVDVPAMDRQENDVEHSYFLAMTAWMFAERFFPSLRQELVVRYALVHDLVEVYAGDTPIFSKNPADHATKAAREHAAQQRLAQEFSSWASLHDAIAAYEARADDEAKLVYTLDKILPVLTIYLGHGKTWHRVGVTLDMLATLKRPKIAIYPPMVEFFEEVVTLLQEDPALFPKGDFPSA